MKMIDTTWLIYLAIPAAWTTLFSLSTKPALRGWRNFGILACYGVGIAMVIAVGWRTGGATWCAVGFAAGLLYYLYDLVGSWGGPEQRGRARLATIAHGLFVWPVMLPEVIEYALADAGVLRGRTSEGFDPGAGTYVTEGSKKLAVLQQADVDAFPEGAVWNAFVQLVGTSEARELGDEQLPAFRAYWYDSEVLNGGHLQYFLNRGLEEAEAAVSDLKRIRGADAYSELLARAVSMWRARERTAPQSVEEYVETAAEGELDELDEAHAALRPRLMDLLEVHLERHRDDFVRVE